MITILICLFCGLIIGLFYAYAENEYEWHIYLIYGLVGMAMGSCFGVLVASIVVDKDSEVYLSSTTKIESMTDNSLTTGELFLGCGTIEGRMKYCFYEKTKDNEYQLKVIDCDDATISYTDGEPIIETYAMRWIDTKHNRRYTFGNDVSRKLTYKIYVPKGSIRQNFQLDAQ